MKKIKFIEEFLLGKSIFKYRIIEEELLKFRHKSISKNINSEEAILKNIYIYFDFDNHSFKLKINEEASSRNIENLIIDSLNLCKSKIDVKAQNNTFSENSICNLELHSVDYYAKIVEKNVQNTLKKINFKLNVSYGLEIYNYKMLTDKKVYNQQFVHSDYFFYKNDDYSVNAYISLNKDLETSSSSLICEQFNLNRFPKKRINLNKDILFKSKVVSELINQYVSCFYASNIYTNNSFIKKHEISKKIFDFKFDLESMPFESILFDPEGFFTEKFYLIKDNELQNVLCNSFFSKLLSIKSTGNAGFFDHDSITHQNIKVIPKCSFKNENLNYHITIDFIKILSFDPDTTALNAQVIFFENENKYQSEFSMNLNSIFEKSIFGSYAYQSNNVECGDMFYCP